jgi:hypothetical protein
MKMEMGRLFLFLAFFSLAAEWGCGYKFQGQGTPLDPEIHSVAIPIFGNRTSQTGIESEVTRALVDKFTSTRRLSVRSQATADSVLLGTVKSFLALPIAVTTGQQVTTGYRVTVSLEVVFQRKTDGKVLCKETISEWRNYPVVVDLATTENNKREAISQISTILAERIQEMILGSF